MCLEVFSASICHLEVVLCRSEVYFSLYLYSDTADILIFILPGQVSISNFSHIFGTFCRIAQAVQNAKTKFFGNAIEKKVFWPNLKITNYANQAPICII